MQQSRILKTSKIIKFVDRDDKNISEITENLSKGINTLQKRHVESYLWDDEIIKKLCIVNGKIDKLDVCLSAKQDAINESIGRGNPADDIKSASPKIYYST